MTTFPVKDASLEVCTSTQALAGAIPLCRPSKCKMIRSALPSGIELITLQIRSANAWLNPWLAGLSADRSNQLIGVASHWPEFLEIARTMLVAAGLNSDMLIFRDVRKPRWTRGLEQTTAIICDAYTATVPAFPTKPSAMIFPLLADSAQVELNGYANPRSVL